MSAQLSVFLDSDVVISSQLSSSGAAHILIDKEELVLYISNISKRDLEQVATRLKLEKEKLQNLIKTKFKVVSLKDTIDRIKKRYADYTLDINDTHIVMGAFKAKVRFLVTYNKKHFKEEKIKKEFGIIVLRPAELLQYLRIVT